MARAKIKESEEDFNEEDLDNESPPLKGPLISYGADYTLDAIRQYVAESKQLIVQPTFQRKFVWDIKKASKLIESLVLGYPVPNILLGRNPETEIMEVIDGQQRILSICDYFAGTFRSEQVFKLAGDDIDKRYAGKTFKDLDDATQSKLKNAVLKAVVLVYPKDDPNIKFTAFQRINTGSVVLKQQEIRNCIYGGSFNDLINDLNDKNQIWRKMLVRKPDKRMRDVETILRFYAAYFDSKNYEKPITTFLNNFMEKNRNLSADSAEEWRKLFVDTLTTIQKKIGTAFPRSPGNMAFNRAIFESVMVAVARLDKEGKLKPLLLKKKYLELIKDKKYIAAILSQTSDKKKYSDRLSIAYNKLA